MLNEKVQGTKASLTVQSLLQKGAWEMRVSFGGCQT